MPPTSDGDNARTVGCSLEKLIPNAAHRAAIRATVAHTHKATVLASELLNIHIRRLLEEDPSADLGCCFNGNWVLNAFMAVTAAQTKRKTKAIPELDASAKLMPPFEAPPRMSTQCLNYEARSLAVNAATHVWRHFQRRVHEHTKRAHRLDSEAYRALSKDERKARKVELAQVANDLCRRAGVDHQSPVSRHTWVANERRRLGIDSAVGNWGDKDLLYHLKARPHRFVNSLRLMSIASQEGGGKSFVLYPLRHHLVPRHARFDQDVLRTILGLGASAHNLEQKRAKVGDGQAAAAPSQRAPKRGKEEMRAEKAELFARVVDLRKAGVHRRSLFDYAFTTDGVCARLVMRNEAPDQKETAGSGKLKAMPKRGIYAIDQLKHVVRSGNGEALQQQLHVIGVDPGKHEVRRGLKLTQFILWICACSHVHWWCLCSSLVSCVAACGVCGYGRCQGLQASALYCEAAATRHALSPV